MEKHITVLGTLYIVFSVLGILTGMFVFFLLAGVGMLSGDDTAVAVLGIVGTVIGMFLVVTSIPGIIGGIWLMKRREWARILLIILGFLNLINIPLGTILGIYTIWALMNSEMIALFSRQGSPSAGPAPTGPVT